MDALIDDDQFSRDLFFTMEGQIKGGSLEKLIERLTHHSIEDNEFMEAFFITYPSFATPAVVLSLLILRFQLQVPDNLSPTEEEFFLENKIKPMQYKVVNVITHWVETLPELFETDDDLRASLIEFMITNIQDSIPSAVTQVETALNGVAPNKFPSLRKDEKVPHPIIPKSLRGVTILSIDPLEIARHVCSPRAAYFFLSFRVSPFPFSSSSLLSITKRSSSSRQRSSSSLRGQRRMLWTGPPTSRP